MILAKSNRLQLSLFHFKVKQETIDFVLIPIPFSEI